MKDFELGDKVAAGFPIARLGVIVNIITSYTHTDYYVVSISGMNSRDEVAYTEHELRHLEIESWDPGFRSDN